MGGLFPDVDPGDLERPAGPVNLLLGLIYSSLHPVLQPGCTGDLRLLSSRFGTGLLIDGWHDAVAAANVKINHLAHKYGQAQVQAVMYNTEAKVNHVVAKKPASSLLELEELGTQVLNW